MTDTHIGFQRRSGNLIERREMTQKSLGVYQHVGGSGGVWISLKCPLSYALRPFHDEERKDGEGRNFRAGRENVSG